MNTQSSSVSSPAGSQTASAESISRRAYELWEQEGKPEGQDLRHWLQAEQELSVSGPARSGLGASSGLARNTGADTRPLQGTRAGAAVTRENKPGHSGSPFERAPARSGVVAAPPSAKRH